MSKNKIIILSTHIVSDVEYISDKIVIMKSGKIMLNNTPSNIIKNIDNKIWTCNISESKLSTIESNFNIVNINRLSEGLVNVRVISETKPCGNAKIVLPTLEDLYLYYFPVV